MAFLDFFKLKRRKPRPVGQTLETGREVPTGAGKSDSLIRFGLLAGLFVLTVLAFPREQSYELSGDIGSVWTDDDVVAPFQFPIFKSDEEMEAAYRNIRLQTLPVFELVPGALGRTLNGIDSLRAQFSRIFTLYGNALEAREQGQTQQATQDSILFRQRQAALPFTLTPRQWSLLLDSYAARVPGLPSTSRAGPNDPSLDEQLLNELRTISQRLLEEQVINIDKDSLIAPEVIIRNRQVFTERSIQKESLMDLEEARMYARQRLQDRFGRVPDTLAMGLVIFNSVFVPNVRFLERETRENIEQEMALVAPAAGQVQEGEIIIRRGELVDSESHARLLSLQRTLSEQGGSHRAWRLLLGQASLTFFCFMVFFLFLFLLRRELFDSRRDMTLIVTLFLIMVGLFAAAVHVPYPANPGLLVPIALVPILLTVIYDSRVAFVATVAVSLLGGCIFGFDFDYVVMSILAGTLGAFSIRGVKNRGQFMITAGIVLLTYVVALTVFELFRLFSMDRYLTALVLVGINAILLLLALPLLWMFERVFDVTTDVSLLELSDTNQPLLRELSLRAPGTFNHSLQVANLAEAAADAIGANALMTRVGALYHDIGKMLKPEYYVENQTPGENPHDKLTPKMSALIIEAHVKDGLDLARQRKLPRVIQEFIPMHHGTTRIEFFYRKALEQKKPNEEILETDFRYPGPRPTTKETAIMILADGVEAASKSVANASKPTPKKFETLVDSIFRDRLEDGQLDHSPLTFADLRQIRDTFVSILSGMYHFRVKYPDQDKKLERAGEEADEESSSKEPDADRRPNASPVNATREFFLDNSPRLDKPKHGDGSNAEASKDTASSDRSDGEDRPDTSP